MSGSVPPIGAETSRRRVMLFRKAGDILVAATTDDHAAGRQCTRTLGAKRAHISRRRRRNARLCPRRCSCVQERRAGAQSTCRGNLAAGDSPRGDDDRRSAGPPRSVAVRRAQRLRERRAVGVVGSRIWSGCELVVISRSVFLIVLLFVAGIALSQLPTGYWLR